MSRILGIRSPNRDVARQKQLVSHLAAYETSLSAATRQSNKPLDILDPQRLGTVALVDPCGLQGILTIEHLLIETRRLLKKRLKRLKHIAKTIDQGKLLQSIKATKRSLKQDLEQTRLVDIMDHIIQLEQECLDVLSTKMTMTPSIDLYVFEARHAIDNTESLASLWNHMQRRSLKGSLEQILLSIQNAIDRGFDLETNQRYLADSLLNRRDDLLYTSRLNPQKGSVSLHQ